MICQRFLSIGLVFCLLAAGCTGRAKRVRSDAESLGKVGVYCVSGQDTAVASWYGKDFHGRKTSNGEVYNMHALTAAHRTLPFGTVLEVTECKRGKSVQVRVNDRGPFIPGRDLDLSFGAAQAIGMVADGVARIGMQIVGSPTASSTRALDARVSAPVGDMEVASLPTSGRLPHRTDDLPETPAHPQNRSGPLGGTFAVQVGAYQVKENALQMEERLRSYHPTAHMEVHETNLGFFYRVRTGPYLSEEEAQSVAREIPLQVLEEDGTRPVVVRID